MWRLREPHIAYAHLVSTSRHALLSCYNLIRLAFSPLPSRPSCNAVAKHVGLVHETQLLEVDGGDGLLRGNGCAFADLDDPRG